MIEVLVLLSSVRQDIMRLSPRLIKLMNYWPPFWGSGIQVQSVNAELSEINVKLKLKWWNRNFVGTQYGGSLYSMTDSFYMLMLIYHLGPDYIVWDKAATIRFKRPGKGPVFAKFTLTAEQITAIKKLADENPKTEPEITVIVTDHSGETVAEVSKILYVKRKKPSL